MERTRRVQPADLREVRRTGRAPPGLNPGLEARNRMLRAGRRVLLLLKKGIPITGCLFFSKLNLVFRPFHQHFGQLRNRHSHVFFQPVLNQADSAMYQKNRIVGLCFVVLVF